MLMTESSSFVMTLFIEVITLRHNNEYLLYTPLALTHPSLMCVFSDLNSREIFCILLNRFALTYE